MVDRDSPKLIKKISRGDCKELQVNQLQSLALGIIGEIKVQSDILNESIKKENHFIKEFLQSTATFIQGCHRIVLRLRGTF